MWWAQLLCSQRLQRTVKELAFRSENDDTSVINSARANTTAKVLILKVGYAMLMFSFEADDRRGYDLHRTLNSLRRFRKSLAVSLQLRAFVPKKKNGKATQITKGKIRAWLKRLFYPSGFIKNKNSSPVMSFRPDFTVFTRRRRTETGMNPRNKK